jgi:hypothetical protein
MKAARKLSQNVGETGAAAESVESDGVDGLAVGVGESVECGGVAALAVGVGEVEPSG